MAGQGQERLRAQRAEVAHLKMTLSPDGGLNEIGAISLVRNDFVPVPKALQPAQKRCTLHSMAQAIMDPEQVRRFAEELKRFNADLQDKIVSLQTRFAALGDTWQDQEHLKFAEEFKQIMKALKKFVEVSNQQTPYLLRKAQRIEEYLNQR